MVVERTKCFRLSRLEDWCMRGTCATTTTFPKRRASTAIEIGLDLRLVSSSNLHQRDSLVRQSLSMTSKVLLELFVHRLLLPNATIPPLVGSYGSKNSGLHRNKRRKWLRGARFHGRVSASLLMHILTYSISSSFISCISGLGLRAAWARTSARFAQVLLRKRT